MSIIIKQLEDKFGQILPGHDNEVRVNCQECQRRGKVADNKFHLYINPVKIVGDKVGAFNCFRCGYKGIGLSRLGLEENLQIPDWEEVLKLITESPKARNILWEIDGGAKKDLLKSSKKFIEFPAEYSSDFARCPTGIAAYRYLIQTRGLTDSQIVKHKIGYCTGGKYSGCIILPVLEDGKLVYFVARSISKRQFINCDAPSSSVVFNYTGQENIILVESILDAIKIGDSAIALLGKKMKQEQFLKLIKGAPKRLFIFLDDNAKNEAVEIYNKFSGYIGHIKIIHTTNDIGELTKKQVFDCINSAYNNPAEFLAYAGV